MSSPNIGKSSHGSRITNMRFTSCPLKSFCLYIRNFSVFFTLPEKNFFEKVLCLTQCYRLEGRGFSQFGQKNKTDLSKLTDRFFAVPRRGASCYGKNAKNTMRIFGIPTIFLYYLLYFCVSIRDIVGFLWCEPACNNLIYCYYNTRFAPTQPLLHILCRTAAKP